MSHRMGVFACASIGTFVLYLAVGEMSGLVVGTPLEFLPGTVIALLILKTTFILTSGHGIALRVLAFVLRGYATPSARRSAAAGLICSTALEMAYLSSGWISDISQRGIVRLGFATIVSVLVCAVRARRRDEQPAPSGRPTPAVAIEAA